MRKLKLKPAAPAILGNGAPVPNAKPGAPAVAVPPTKAAQRALAATATIVAKPIAPVTAPATAKPGKPGKPSAVTVAATSVSTVPPLTEARIATIVRDLDAAKQIFPRGVSERDAAFLGLLRFAAAGKPAVTVAAIHATGRVPGYAGSRKPFDDSVLGLRGRLAAHGFIKRERGSDTFTLLPASVTVAAPAPINPDTD